MARHNNKARRRHKQVSTGVIHIARKGYGFVDTPEGEYFILRRYLHGAMDGDLVEVVRLRALEARRHQQLRRQDARQSRFGNGSGSSSGGREMLGSVRRVLERAHQTLIGTLRYRDGLGVVCPFDEHIPYDIFIDHRIPGGRQAEDGAVVVVRITVYPSRIEAAQGFIEEVIGQQDDEDIGMEVIIREHGFETDFSPAALAEAEQLVQEAASTPAGNSASHASDPQRRDLRGQIIFTIDPADARDFDDALSVEFVDGQMHLGVHIADVGAYVTWDSALDLDARRRATSVYLPDRVIPMLPAPLSENLCSLRPGEDRLAFTVEMVLDSGGSVVNSAFYPSFIRSCARLSYDEVQQLLDGGQPATGQSATGQAPELAGAATAVPASAPAPRQAPGQATGPSTSVPATSAPTLVPPAALTNRLHALHRLAKKLARRRIQRGAIEFESTEAKLDLDDSGHPLAVRLRSKTDATSLVEEAMILANEQVAAHMLASEAPMVYRVHEEPYPAALDELLETLQEFGYAQQQAPHCSREIQAVLEASAGRPEHQLVSSLLLRAMKRAKYAATCSPHFGLAAFAYTHFTSPIRRYPDLMAHRLLRAVLCGEPPAENLEKQIEWICAHSSERERDAEQAAREATALKLCEYLEPCVGQRFDALITGVRGTGLTVREETTTAEGFIETEDLPEELRYDEGRHRYYDPGSGRVYRLGQPVVVILKGIDRAHARLQFVIA
ncbi:MAG: RNB domain-containing ribonuclease [Coriobacteriales bacterium]|jgi:ribonuclease R|nr:RNB domain-containing ribonuclease [Coriobacteriales bacterium]